MYKDVHWSHVNHGGKVGNIPNTQELESGYKFMLHPLTRILYNYQ